MRSVRAKTRLHLKYAVKITVKHFTFEIKKVVTDTFHLDKMIQICLTLKSEIHDQVVYQVCV